MILAELTLSNPDDVVLVNETFGVSSSVMVIVCCCVPFSVPFVTPVMSMMIVSLFSGLTSWVAVMPTVALADRDPAGTVMLVLAVTL